MKRINFINHSIPREWGLHLFSWIFLFGFPGMLMHHGREGLAGTEWIRILGAPLTLCIVFYANYLVWIEKYWMTHKIKEFCTANIVTFLLAFIFSRFWFLAMDILFPLHTQRPPFEHTTMTEVFFYFREFINYCYATALAGSLRMSQQWHKAELGRQEAELKRTEAELQNLKNQINPHFLLNTLNNIYALIAFDQDKAQQAVQDLSKLLRHVLYENDQHYTSLNHEIEFLKNYISLMRIRLSDQVEVKLDINIPKENNLKIAPLIFISLIENAFKHGVSPTEPSFIHITLESDNQGTIHFKIANSNFPKKQNDVSGSGIGLEQVQKRLELMYPNKYEWTRNISPDNKIYTSSLTLQT